MTSNARREYEVRRAGEQWAITYTAMASPCEILVDCDGASEADYLASLAYVETLRIEHKFSRYRDDNLIHAINHCNGAAVPVDDETARLLHYAGQCYELSQGRFDITSGILRHAWTFDGREAAPDEARIESLLGRVGWDKVEFDGGSIRLAAGMEIDLGGIGKEYAADRVAAMVAQANDGAALVNLGGDIRATAGKKATRRWTIGIEEPGRDGEAVGQIEISEGGVATSGDARRFCLVGGERRGHILDPRNGWPVAGAPRSATVVADTCTSAGFLATMAMLHGPDAEAFLDAQEVIYHCIR